MFVEQHLALLGSAKKSIRIIIKHCNTKWLLTSILNISKRFYWGQKRSFRDLLQVLQKQMYSAVKWCMILWNSQWIHRVWLCTTIKPHYSCTGVTTWCMLKWWNIRETVMCAALLPTLLVPVPPINAWHLLFSWSIQLPLQPIQEDVLKSM